MPKSISSASNFDSVCASVDPQQPQRHAVKQARAANKPISKKVQARQGLKKMGLRKKKLSICSVDTNCQLISIEESTQRGLSSSSSPQDSMQAETEEPISPQFDSTEKPINSNLPHQRYSELKEYLDSISNHMVKKESLYIPNSIADPSSISECNRSKIVSWIFTLCANFRFQVDTAFMATNFVDRAIGMVRLPLEKLALLGITALFMATKYQEIMIPHIDSFVAVVPSYYQVTKQSILRMEGVLINLFEFNLGYESPLLFIHQSDLVTPLPQFVKQRACHLAKDLVMGSEHRSLSSSQIASECLRMAHIDYQETLTYSDRSKLGFPSVVGKVRV